MDEQKSKRWKFVAGFLGIIVLTLVLYVGVRSYVFLSEQRAELQAPKPDEIIITKLPNGDQLVENKSHGYRVEVPTDWTVNASINSGNGSIQFLTPQDGNSCVYSLSKIPNDGKLSFENWYPSFYGEPLPKNSRNVSIRGRDSLEIIFPTPRPSKVVYIIDNSTVYSFAYYPLLESCEPSFQGMLSSFDF